MLFISPWLCIKRLDRKAMVNSKIYDVTNWIKNSYNTHIAKYDCSRNPTMKFGQLIEYNMVNIFLQK